MVVSCWLPLKKAQISLRLTYLYGFKVLGLLSTAYRKRLTAYYKKLAALYELRAAPSFLTSHFSLCFLATGYRPLDTNFQNKKDADFSTPYLSIKNTGLGFKVWGLLSTANRKLITAYYRIKIRKKFL